MINDQLASFKGMLLAPGKVKQESFHGIGECCSLKKILGKVVWIGRAHRTYYSISRVERFGRVLLNC